MPHELKSRILVVGMGRGALDTLPDLLLKRITAAHLLVGNPHRLMDFPDFVGEKLALGSDIVPVVQRLQHALVAGEQAVVLAEGDPLCYGIGSGLRSYFAADTLEIVPAPTLFQQAFAALVEPWHDATLLSIQARPFEEVLAAAQQASKAAILTDSVSTPAVIAQALLEAGVSPDTTCAVCENPGRTDQRIVRSNLAKAAHESHAALNVLVIWEHEEARRRRREGARSATQATQPDSPPPPPVQASQTPCFSHQAERALLTHNAISIPREMRLLILAQLSPTNGDVVWDIGAGNGALSIEAARAQPGATIYAIEQNPANCQTIRENIRRFPAANVRVLEGVAPEVCDECPQPNAVFIGGSNGLMNGILNTVQQRLKAGGRLVLLVASLALLLDVRQRLPGARIVQVQMNVGVAIQNDLVFEPVSPMFLVSYCNG